MPSKWCICGNFTYNKLDGVTKYCKVAILGDKGCGKSALVQAYLAEAIEQNRPDVPPTHARIYRAHCDVRAHTVVQLEIWDFTGGSSHNLKLPSDVDVILLCVDVSRPEGLDGVTKRWLRTVRDQCPRQGLVLVGCKCDLRNDINTIARLASCRQIAITFNQAIMTARISGAIAYVETSAQRCSRTVHQLFEVAALHHIGKLTKRHLVFQRQKSVQKHSQEAHVSTKPCSFCLGPIKFSFSFLKRAKKPALCCFR